MTGIAGFILLFYICRLIFGFCGKEEAERLLMQCQRLELEIHIIWLTFPGLRCWSAFQILNLPR